MRALPRPLRIALLVLAGALAIVASVRQSEKLQEIARREEEAAGARAALDAWLDERLAAYEPRPEPQPSLDKPKAVPERSAVAFRQLQVALAARSAKRAAKLFAPDVAVYTRHQGVERTAKTAKEGEGALAGVLASLKRVKCSPPTVVMHEPPPGTPPLRVFGEELRPPPGDLVMFDLTAHDGDAEVPMVVEVRFLRGQLTELVVADY